MPRRIVAPFRSLVVPDTEPSSSTLPIGYQSARRVGRKQRNAADKAIKWFLDLLLKPVLQKKSLSIHIKSVIFLMLMQKPCPFSASFLVSS